MIMPFLLIYIVGVFIGLVGFRVVYDRRLWDNRWYKRGDPLKTPLSEEEEDIYFYIYIWPLALAIAMPLVLISSGFQLAASKCADRIVAYRQKKTDTKNTTDP